MPLNTALDAIAGLQAQYAPSMYIGLWSRLESFRREDLNHALERRSVVQGTLMRATIHLVSAGDYWPFAIAIRSARRRWWLKVQPHNSTAQELAAAARRLRRRLGNGPIRRAELDEIVGRHRSAGVGLWLDLVRVPPSGTWERRRADLYEAAEDWLGAPPDVTPQAALQHLLRRYLRAFGPATPGEVAAWAGLPVREVTSGLGKLGPRRFRSEDGQELFDLPGAPLPNPDTPAPVRFLPTWDATLLVHARRKGILSEEYRPLVFNTKTPHSVATFLVDGAVAGTWRYERGSVRVEPFRSLDRSTAREVHEEAERLADLHA